MKTFDPEASRALLLGDCGVDFYLSRALEKSQAVGGLATSADGYIGIAIECLLVGFYDPAKQLLEKARHWVQTAIETNEIPPRHVRDGTEAHRFHTLAMCNWLLHGSHDTENLQRFVNHEDRFMAATGLDKQRLQVMLISSSYLNAGAYKRVLELLSNLRGPVAPKNLTAIRNEGQMAYVLCRHRLGLEPWSSSEVQMAAHGFLDRKMNEWLIDGHYGAAGEWLKIVYWQMGRTDLTPKEVVMKAYEHLSHP